MIVLRSISFFSKHVLSLIGLNYFKTKQVKNAEILMCLLKEGAVRKYALLATKIDSTDRYCYIGFSNWLTLNEGISES